jgi:hypothetical protein
MILQENSHYGDHQPGKTSHNVVIYKELMLLMIQLQKNSPIKLLLWDHVLDYKTYQELLEP